MTCYALQGFSRGISSLIISALRQVIILLPLASILGKAIGINGIWWSFLISETVTVIRNVRHCFQSSNPKNRKKWKKLLAIYYLYCYTQLKHNIPI